MKLSLLLGLSQVSTEAMYFECVSVCLSRRWGEDYTYIHGSVYVCGDRGEMRVPETEQEKVEYLFHILAKISIGRGQRLEAFITTGPRSS